RAMPDQVGERLDAQHVVEVDGERVVKIFDGDVARQTKLVAQCLRAPESLRTFRSAERVEMFGADPPAREREDEPSTRDARQKLRFLEGRPAPREHPAGPLVLQRPEESIEPK